MEILNRLFSRGVKIDGSEDLMKISKVVGPLIDKTVNDIFVSYREKLVTGPITYIVPAVWGARKEGEPDRTQKEILTDHVYCEQKKI